MKKTFTILATTCLLASVNGVNAKDNDPTANSALGAADQPVLTLPITHNKAAANDDYRAFAVDVKGYINSDGTRNPYNTYRHSLNDIEDRIYVGSHSDEDARPYALAWSADATQLYGISRTDIKKLIAIDPETAAVSEIATFSALSNQTIQGMAIDQNNTCYIITTDDQNHDTVSTLYTCNLSTGALTLIGSQSSAPDLHDIAATCDDKIYGVDSASHSLYEVNKSDGSAAYVGTMDVSDENGLYDLTYDRKNGVLYQYVLSTSGIYTALATLNKNDAELSYVTDVFRLGVLVGAVESSCDERVDTFQLHPGFNGAWINPETAGQGFLFDLYPTTDLFFAAWFTFDDGVSVAKAGNIGSSEQRWVTASGSLGDDQVVELTLYNTTGGVFDDAAATETTPVGSMSIEFTDCANGQVSYEFDDNSLSGSFPIQRVAGDNVELCENMGANTANR